MANIRLQPFFRLFLALLWRDEPVGKYKHVSVRSIL